MDTELWAVIGGKLGRRGCSCSSWRMDAASNANLVRDSRISDGAHAIFHLKHPTSLA